MTKHSTKKEKKVARPSIGAIAPTSSTQAAAGETPAAPATQPGAASLTPLPARRGARSRPEKPTAKELSALAKKAARAQWSERMDAEGR